jgi:hypothetical protein
MGINRRRSVTRRRGGRSTDRIPVASCPKTKAETICRWCESGGGEPVAKHALSSNRLLPDALAVEHAFGNVRFHIENNRSTGGVNMRFFDYI